MLFNISQAPCLQLRATATLLETYVARAIAMLWSFDPIIITLRMEMYLLCRRIFSSSVGAVG